MRWIAALLIVAACRFELPGAGNADGTDADPPSWWDPAWSARLRIGIDTAAALVQGFQIGVRHDLDMAPCDGPRDAVRVVRDHTAELPRVIDELGGGDEWIWFRIDASRAAGTGPSEYWVYCGNPGAGPAPGDPAAVFDLYDSFDGSSLSAIWRAQGAVTVGGGAVTLPGNNTGIHSVATFGPGTATDFVLQVSSGALGDPHLWCGFETEFTSNPPWATWYTDEANVMKQWIRTGAEVPMNERTLDAAPHLYGVENYGLAAGFRLGNAGVATLAFNAEVTVPLNVRLHNYNSAGSIQFQMARVRKAVNPIPTATLGPVENRP